MKDNIIFTKHVLLKIKQRKIPENFIIKTILKPNKLVLDNNKYYAYRNFGKKYLKVVFVKINNSILIITAHWAQKL